jgi:hypothetical protein
MATLTAAIAPSPFGRYGAPYQSPDLSGYATFVFAPRAHAGLVAAPSGAVPVRVVAAALSRQLPAGLAGQYVQDYYNRIHINPNRLALGNISSDQSETVRVWNSYFVARSLTSLNGVNDNGISATGPSSPVVLNTLQEKPWEITVGLTGDSVSVDVEIVWAFDQGSGALTVTAERIVAWPILPDWGDDGMLERLSWLTEMLRSPTGVEQRRQKRIVPRRELEATLKVARRERSLLDLMLNSWGSRIFALPWWPDVQYTSTPLAVGATFIPCVTAGVEWRVGSLVMLRGDSAFRYEAHEIDSITTSGIKITLGLKKAWPAGTGLYPVVSAELMEQPTATRITDIASSVPVHFRILDADFVGIAPEKTYRNFPVFELVPEESEDLTGGYQRLMAELDNGMALPLNTDTAGKAFWAQSHRWKIAGRAAQQALRQILYYLNGRQKAVWVPTHAADLVIAAPISAVATVLTIENIEYNRFGVGQYGRRDIRIELCNGAVFYRRIVAASPIDEDTEQIELNAALGVDASAAAVFRVSFMVLARSDQDDVEIQHLTDSAGLTACQVVFRGVRDDDV